MAIADVISSMQAHTKAAYDALTEKGATIPDEKNLANLSEAISSITGGGESESEIDFAEHPDAYMAYKYLNTDNAITVDYVTDETQALDYIENGRPHIDNSVLFLELQFSPLCANLDTVVELTRPTCAMIETDEWGSQEMIIPNTVGGLQNFTQVTAIGDEFLHVGGFNGGTLITLNGGLPPNITSIGNFFMQGQTKFNGNLDLSSLTSLQSIGESFLQSCQQFNSPITIPNSVTSIGSNFMNNCQEFNNDVTLPSTLEIPAYYLSGCSKFNQPVTIPATQTQIYSGFLSGCTSFNQAITLPNTITSIGTNFIASCSNFDQPITLPANLISIGEGFLRYSDKFNQPLTIPDSVTTIGENFMYSCTLFNSSLHISTSLTSIAPYFMTFCHNFNQNFVIPNSVTIINREAFYQCDNMISTITVENSTISTGDYPGGILSVLNLQAPAFTEGIKVNGAGASRLMLILPNGNRGGGAYRNLIDVN